MKICITINGSSWSIRPGARLFAAVGLASILAATTAFADPLVSGALTSSR